MAALVAIQANDHEAALQRADQFAREFAQRDRSLMSEVRAIRAEALLQLGRYEESARGWKKLIRDQPEQARNTDWPLRLAVCYQESGDPGSVVRALRKFDPQDDELRGEAALLMAAAQGELGDERAATQTLERLLKQRPKKEQRARAQLLLVSLQRRAGDTDEALATLARLKRDAPELVPSEVHLEQADLLYQKGAFAEAAKSYQDAVKGARETEVAADAMLGWGWSLLEADQVAQAEQVFAEITDNRRFEQRHPEATYGRAVALYRRQQYRDSMKLLQRFLRTREGTEEDRADATYLLGMCQVETEAFGDAIETLTGLVKKFPKYAANDQALYELAWAFDSKGADQEAAATFEALASLFPDSKLTWKTLNLTPRSSSTMRRWDAPPTHLATSTGMAWSTWRLCVERRMTPAPLRTSL